MPVAESRFSEADRLDLPAFPDAEGAFGEVQEEGSAPVSADGLDVSIGKAFPHSVLVDHIRF